jgi:hypothetical protein
MSPRMRYLIHEFAKAYLDGRDPFSLEFLQEHKVTADECISMEEFIGSVLMMYIQQSGGIRDTT